MLKKIVTLFMLLAALAIHAADPIIMTNTSLDLKLSLYPVESSEEGSIVFWTNKGKVERWSITTASGKNYEMAVKSRYVVKQDGITKYMVKSSLDKGTFIKVFKNDLPVSVSFQIKGFANGQYATIDLPQDIKNHFASELENFNRPKQQLSSPAGIVKFMGFPLEGDVEAFAKQLEANGWKFHSKSAAERSKNTVLFERWFFSGRFWKLKNCSLIVWVMIDSSEVFAVSVLLKRKELSYSILEDLINGLIKKHGKPIKMVNHNCIWNIGKSRIITNDSFIPYNEYLLGTYHSFVITYERNDLWEENQKRVKIYLEDIRRKDKEKREQENNLYQNEL